MSEIREGGGWLLALDTSTTTIVVAAGSTDGALIAAEAFEGRYRHSQELLPATVRMIEAAGLRLDDLAGVVVGTGPGAFTGLRVGIATAKTLAHELGRPLVGIPSSTALLEAVGGDALLWLPAGPRDRVMVRVGGDPVVVPGATSVAIGGAQAGATVADDGEAPAGAPRAAGTREAAVDLAGRASEAALTLGRQAVAGLPEALLRLGAARLARGESDDPERLVPGYASPPRGAAIEAPEGSMAWSRDPR